MPEGTPLGLGILGAAKFSAIRRVLEHANRAALAKANLHTAEGTIARALVGREIAREQLRNVGTICEEESDRIREGAMNAKLLRRLERMELEDRIAEKESQRAKLRGGTGSAEKESAGVAPDDFVSFMSDLKRMPEIIKAVSDAKEQVIKNAGGEDKLSEADKQACEMLDAMMQSFMAKKAEDSVL
jgi:hypothetical protein